MKKTLEEEETQIQKRDVVIIDAALLPPARLSDTDEVITDLDLNFLSLIALRNDFCLFFILYSLLLFF